jgi:ATP-dependent helicase/nuclease subunit A
MSAARKIPDVVRGVQIEAANPDISAFVSANAGSGKTYVLAQRVINLLLNGCDPAKILCITFTKTAAANMANEVFSRLSEWATLDDTELDERIRLSTGKKPSAGERARARRLFASALETPGGLKVQTIHAFCTRLLHQFPFEANVAARFSVLDEASTAQLLEQLTMQVLMEAAAKPDSRLGKALAAAIIVAADITFKEVIGDAIKARDTIQGWIAQAGGLDNAIAGLSQGLGVAPDDSIERFEQEFFAASLISDDEWPSLIAVLETGAKSDINHIDALTAARTAASTRERIDNYLRIFCTGERAPRKNLLTNPLADRHPEWLARLQAEQQRVLKLLNRERALEARERTRALVTIAAEVIARYQSEKERRALLDYDDLIDKTLPLLSDGAASWVHYKLDLGIDHMLIDEAQDTSPKQWGIIRQLASEFVPGGSRSDVRRTIFAVGDEKQSIFSFQGAAPHAFSESRRHFQRIYSAADREFTEKKFEFSFRSGEIILGAVDKVYSRPEAFTGLTADPVRTAHSPLPDAAPGEVELWPLIVPAEKKEIEGWDAPFDTESESSPRVQLARKIAAHVKLLCDRGLSPRDVLVLVRQRGPLFEAIIRALKDTGVPVAGADRLVLTEHIAVMDLMALADCLLLPDDDLALASVLKSPLFGLTEEQLFELAWQRKGSLRASLQARTGDALFAAINGSLDGLWRVAREKSPFTFFAHVLGPQRGRRRFLARLGPEANDALDEFLNLALDYEERETPSLQGFLAWLRAARSEVKRDMELARDEVRVMTVHGAKGLEANTVILADTTTEPKGAHPPRLLTLSNGALVWLKRKQDDTDVMVDARERADGDARDEYRRLLYVAMTRAAERLVVCGARGPKKIPSGCWYELIDDALRADCMREPADDGVGEVLRYRKAGSESEKATDGTAAAREKIHVPGWLGRNAPHEPDRELAVSPSAAIDDNQSQQPAAGTKAALLRGSLTHRLLELLPDIAIENRSRIAADYLDRTGGQLEPPARASIAEQAVRLLQDPRFAELFAPGSRAEVPIVGRIEAGGKTIRVSGQVDRLAVTSGNVLIGDFKTGKPAAHRIDGYVRQLALYRAVLAKIYPDRPVRAALIWTEVPELMEVSAHKLEAALVRVTSA